MYLIAGLGNPGLKYRKTRHNMGYEVLDALAASEGLAFTGHSFRSLTADGRIAGERVLLLKPLTYMNLSGNAVSEALSFYKADPERELIVVSDDISLEPGRIRIRKKGSDGGQKGLKDIIEKIGTNGFTRIRVGIGAKPEGWDLADFVLSRFSKDERKAVDEAVARAAEAVIMVLREGTDAAMNRYNGM